MEPKVTKEQVDEICRLCNNQWETLGKYTGANIHRCNQIRGWIINFVPCIQSFWERKDWACVNRKYDNLVKANKEAAKFIHENMED